LSADKTSTRQKDLYCPICGEFNRGRDVFRCPECGMDLICPKHRDNWLMICSECARMVRTEEFERISIKLFEETPPGMVFVSPGNFIFGRDDGELNCAPAHIVHLPAYYIDEHPVTNAEYQRLMPDHEFKPGFENEPVRGVSWINAKKYAGLAGKRLPTEQEWEKAVRGVDGLNYPWGNELPDDSDVSADEFAARISSLALSQLGIYGGVGDLQEWVEDWYDPYPGNAFNDPSYGKSHKVLRGGNLTPFHPVSASDRRYALPDEHGPDTGFRCAKNTSLVFDYDISEKRKHEKSRINRLVVQLELEKKARNLAKEHEKMVLHDRRITELEDELQKIQDEQRRLIEKELEPGLSRRIMYLLSGFWESLVKVSGRKRDVAKRWVYLLLSIFIIYLFFANILATEKIAFTIKQDEKQFIATMLTSGKSLKIFDNLGEASQPVFSPDGKHIVYVKNIEGNNEIFIAKASGKTPINISNNPGNDTNPGFSQNGHVVWLSDRSGSNDVYTSRLDGSDTKLIPIPAGELGRYDFSSDGKYVTFALKPSKQWEIYIMKANGDEVNKISDESSNCLNPLFAYGNKRILFASNNPGNYELFYMDTDGSNITRVTYTVGDELGGCSFSSSGKWIFADYKDNMNGDTPNAIYKMRWDGKSRKTIYASDTEIGSPNSGLIGFKRFFAGLFHPKYKPRPLKWKRNIKDECGENDLRPLLEAGTRWLKTGIHLHEGDFIGLASQGTWRSAKTRSSAWVDPDGNANLLDNNATIPDKPIGMLIARIGESQPFPVGKSQSFISEHEGELMIMMNDTAKLSDNEGAIIVEVDLRSNIMTQDIRVIPPLTFQHLKYFGFDDGIRSGIPPEKYFGDTRINLSFLSMSELPNPASMILAEFQNGRAVLLEPSNLYYLNPRHLGKSIKSFIESFKEGREEGEEKQILPPFAFYLPWQLPSDSVSSMDEILTALRGSFPDRPVITGITTEKLLASDLDTAYCNKFDCLIVDLPTSINAKGKTTPDFILRSHLMRPIEHARAAIPEMPLIMGIPLNSSSIAAPLASDQIANIVKYYDTVPQVVGVVFSGTHISNDIKSHIGLLSKSITERKFAIDTERRNIEMINPLEVSKVVIGDKKPFKGDFKGLAVNMDDITYTADRKTGTILKIAPDGVVVSQSQAKLPTGIILDDVADLYMDRNERVMLLDAHPGYIVFFDDSLEYADLKKLPGEAPGGIAGITAIVRDKEDYIYTISDDSDLLQKFNKDLSLISWTGGSSLHPGYFLTPSDIAIDSRGSIYVVDRSKQYIQKFNSDLEMVSIIPLPRKDTFFNPVPLFITIDIAGNVYVAEKRTRNVYRYSPAGELVSYFELPAIPTGGIEVTPKGLFRTIMNGKLVSYDLNQETPVPEEEEE